MEGASFLSSSRSIGFRPTPNDSMLAVAGSNNPKSLTPILDRFRALLKEREEEIRVSVGGNDEIEIPAPSTDEIVEFYEVVLSELTLNSKPIITDLTIIAGEQREHGEGIADAICARIIEVPVDQKLPSLYLLDSIVKNIGREYVRHFSARLPEVFCAAYRQVHPNLHPSMRHLFGTWATVFPSSVLRKIEAQLHFSPSSYQSSGLRASESPLPGHGIHVNPKYLEARRQLEHSTADSKTQHARATSTSKIVGKPVIGFDEYESDNGEALSSHMGTQTLGATSHVARTPFGLGHVPPSPALDEFAADDSPRRTVEGASPSRPGYGYNRPGGLIVKEEDLSEWRRPQFETSASYSISNRFDTQRPRALIDAYGTDERDRTTNQKLQHVKSLAINGTESKVGGQPWQNTEEEEFEWENMSPTLADRGRAADMLSSSIGAPGSSKLGHRSINSKTDFSRGNWSNQEQLLPVNDPNNAVPLSDRGLKRKMTGSHGEPSDNPVSHYPQEPWNVSQPWASQQHFNPRGQQPPLNDTFPGANSQHHLTSSPRLNLSNINKMNPEASVSTSTGPWRPPLHTQPSLPFQKHIKNQFEDNKSFLHHQPLDTSESRMPPTQIPQLSNQQMLGQTTMFPPQLSRPQEIRPNFAQNPAFNPSHLMMRPMVRGPTPQRFDASIGASLNPVPGIQSSMPMHLHGVGMPPLPRGPPPSSLHMMTMPQLPLSMAPTPPPGGALSGLFSSLVAQGLLSLTKPAPAQDSVGLEFDADVLKARHESAITALYADLPRQCKTCGLRFKLQEEHSTHMDWHVTKNRISKNRKQKPSRKWFANVSMWLSSAEALGADSVPGFLHPSENVPEEKDDEEMAVPADEDQNVCALCGESFDDFYSDDTEEWMYRGAVYMNAPMGATVGMDRSQLGPIVHAKCRSESTVVSSDDFGNNGGL